VIKYIDIKQYRFCSVLNIPGHILYTFARLKVLEIYILTSFVICCSHSILLSLILLSVFKTSHKISFATVLVVLVYSVRVKVTMNCWYPNQVDSFTEIRFTDVYWTVHLCDNWRIKNQLNATYYFIVLLMGSTCFGHSNSRNMLSP